MKQDQETEAKAGRLSSGNEGRPPAEVKHASGVDNSVPMKEQPTPVKQSLIDQIVSKENMERAYRQVVSNRGSAGVDGMEVSQLKPYLQKHWQRIKGELETGQYRPKPVRKVEIPKSGGGKRMLGIPTVTDRFIQQAIQQVLSRIWEPTFSNGSYGYRPGRKAADAVEQAKRFQEEGYKVVVDIDLSKFFDEVNHKRLMSRIMEKTRGERQVHRLIDRYLKAGIMEGGLVRQREKGTPQGSPLSPLLSNIVLDELDKEMEKRGHKFVRYADDCNVYVKTQRSGERVYKSVKDYLERKMRLKVNEGKSKVDRPWKRKFLGFSFYSKKGGAGIRISPASLQRFRQGIKQLCRQGRGKQVRNFVIYDLNPYLRGWLNYYRIADMKQVVEELDEWVRRRLRLIMWRQWKRNWTRYKRLKAAGLKEERAVQSAFNGRGPWWNSGASHMNQALPKAYFRELGLESLLERYLNYKKTVINGTAVYGTVRTVV